MVAQQQTEEATGKSIHGFDQFGWPVSKWVKNVIQKPFNILLSSDVDIQLSKFIVIILNVWEMFREEIDKNVL